MPLQVTRDQITFGGDFDEVFLENHVCGECRARLKCCWHDGSWWIECVKDRSHNGFERMPSDMELYRRGQNPYLELLYGPPGPNSKLFRRRER